MQEYLSKFRVLTAAKDVAQAKQSERSRKNSTRNMLGLCIIYHMLYSHTVTCRKILPGKCWKCVDRVVDLDMEPKFLNRKKLSRINFI